MPGDVFGIGDTHFHHQNILTFLGACGTPIRPQFKDVDEMDEFIVSEWNAVIRPQDKVYHFGDVWHKPSQILKRLNGHKRLILGNHDNCKTPEIFNAFEKIMMWRVFPEWKLVMTHVPIIIPQNGKYSVNVHGHLHEKQSPTPNHICVSCEALNYRPVNIEQYVCEQLKLRGIER